MVKLFEWVGQCHFYDFKVGEVGIIWWCKKVVRETVWDVTPACNGWYFWKLLACLTLVVVALEFEWDFGGYNFFGVAWKVESAVEVEIVVNVVV